jgi:hypothetical protein
MYHLGHVSFNRAINAVLFRKTLAVSVSGSPPEFRAEVELSAIGKAGVEGTT